MSLFDSILRNPISVLDVSDRTAFQNGPDTFNLYRLTLENGPDLTTDALLRVVASKGLAALYQKCLVRLNGENSTPAARTMRAIGDPFLASYEWATVRYRVLVKRGNACEACHRGPKDGVVINVDHIQNRREHPELALTESNLQILCDGCNKGKGNWDNTDWRQDAGETSGAAGAEPIPS